MSIGNDFTASGDIILTGESSLTVGDQMGIANNSIQMADSEMSANHIVGIQVQMAAERSKLSFGKIGLAVYSSLDAVEQYEKYFKRLEELPDWDYRGTWFRSSEGIWFSAMIPGQEPRFTVTIGVSDIALKKDRRIQEKIVKLFQYTLEHLESGGEEGAYSSS